MSKKDKIEMIGIIKEVLPYGNYKVELIDGGAIINCTKSGKMKQFNIGLLPGDKVDVELNQYDISKGRISFRHKA